MIRKIYSALALTLISASALAGAPGNQMVAPTGTPVIALGSMGYWSLGIEALYVRSTAPQFQYAQIASNTTPENKLSNQIVGNSYQTGFEADATYHFVGNDRDVTLAYTHVDMDDSHTSSIVGSETFAEPFGLLPTPAFLDHVDQIKGSTDNLYNAADLVFGQHMAVGKVLDIHPFGGLRYADLNSRNNSTYYNDPTVADHIQATAQMTSHFQGLGPRAGVGATLYLNNTFSLIGTFGGALEVGYDNPETTLQSNGDLPVNDELNKNWYIVPELDAQIGINFQHCFSQLTALNVQLGYQAVNYFNAVEDDYQDMVNVNSNVNRQAFSFQGPFLRVQLNVA
ncbi:MAG: Lpg1974 family pore-forming outer membrane protein [Gammaproteobacteria bacterium]